MVLGKDSEGSFSVSVPALEFPHFGILWGLPRAEKGKVGIRDRKGNEFDIFGVSTMMTHHYRLEEAVSLFKSEGKKKPKNLTSCPYGIKI